MKKLILVLTGMTLLLMSCSTTPQKFDVSREAPAIETGEGILIGKVENLGMTGGSPTSWRPLWKTLLGVPMTYGIVIDGVESQYSINSDGFFIIRYKAGELKDAIFFYSESSKAGNPGAGVSVSMTNGFRVPLVEKNALKIEAGKVTILPVISVQYSARGELTITRDQTGKRNDEILNWYKTSFPQMPTP